MFFIAHLLNLDQDKQTIKYFIDHLHLQYKLHMFYGIVTIYIYDYGKKLKTQNSIFSCVKPSEKNLFPWFFFSKAHFVSVCFC